MNLSLHRTPWFPLFVSGAPFFMMFANMLLKCLVLCHPVSLFPLNFNCNYLFLVVLLYPVIFHDQTIAVFYLPTAVTNFIFAPCINSIKNTFYCSN